MPAQVSLDGVPLARVPRKKLGPAPRLSAAESRLRMAAVGGAAGGAGADPHLPALGGLPQAFAAARSTQALARLRSDRAQRDQPATTLSGGEFARAMLARAIGGEPEILIVDEPVTGLDPVHAIAVHGAIWRPVRKAARW